MMDYSSYLKSYSHSFEVSCPSTGSSSSSVFLYQFTMDNLFKATVAAADAGHVLAEELAASSSERDKKSQIF
jgi:hypothetical protein